MADKVLIVDDEDGIRKVLALSLNQAGYQVLTASQGSAAIDIVRAEHPAIVLADIKMPGMDGIHLLQKIKEENPDTEVIMMTGHADLNAAVRSLHFEAADFITKPIHFDALEMALKRVHERIWMRQQISQYTQNLERLVSEKTQQLLEAERLAAIGQTVATLAHAIKNIIAGLSGGVFVVEKGLELDNRTYLSQGWEMIRDNVGKIKTLALDLLNYSKNREPDYDLCDPNIPAREVYHLMLARAQQDEVHLKLALGKELGKIYMDIEGIHTCLLNLVTNAIDACLAMPRDATREVTIRTYQPADWAVEYQVTDTGCGMDEATRSQVFRTFFSTKGSRGTGLGLMITRKIIREHGGTIAVESQPGKGSTFSIRLPQRDIRVNNLYTPPPKDEDANDELLDPQS
ncbi:MAG TPA: hybrid sensor histidine kinase/response regulator [Syntrophobacteraceae bacterium]|nr:hybrid sensor histidine kinase/response regulator [Syntrophobacteraceae bacterium]